MNIKYILTIIACAIICLAHVVDGQAQTAAHYWADEFYGAEQGAFNFGTIGFLSNLGMFRGLANYDGDPDELWRQDRFTRWFWHSTRTVGAGVGAVLTGGSKGVNGNVFMAFALPTIYFAMVDGIDEWLCPMAKKEGFCLEMKKLVNFVTYAPVMPAFFATVGFNIGAKTYQEGLQ